MLERYSCNRNVTLSRASCVLCSISATTRWGLDRSYLTHKLDAPPDSTAIGPVLPCLPLVPFVGGGVACASVILRTGLQPSTLRERCRGLDAGVLRRGAADTRKARTQGRADLGLQLRLGLTFHEFLHGKSCDWFRHGSRRTSQHQLLHIARRSWARCSASSVIMRTERTTDAHALSLPLLGEGSLFFTPYVSEV